MYIDCGAGISGDMFLGALLDLGAPKKSLEDIIDQLDLGATISVGETKKKSLVGKKVTVEIEDGKKRSLSEMEKILDRSGFAETVKEKSKSAIRDLAEVEGRLHGENIDTIHFHELGNTDTIVDIAGTFHLLDQLNPGKVYASKINLGCGGTISSEHGELPNPAPATVELLKGIPTYSSIENEETVTPTGAVLLRNIVDDFDFFPSMRIKSTGYGAGEKDFDVPNLLRIMMGEQEEDFEGERVQRIVKIETNLDDCNPELLANATDKLMSAGALDVWQESVQMKKNRAATKLVILCKPEKVPDIKDIIFKETTSLGYRYNLLWKNGLKREIKEVKSKYGTVKVKLGYYRNYVNVAPEFESCRETAERQNASLKEVYRQAEKEAYKNLEEGKWKIG